MSAPQQRRRRPRLRGDDNICVANGSHKRFADEVLWFMKSRALLESYNNAGDAA
jgi:hypothetical protein